MGRDGIHRAVIVRSSPYLFYMQVLSYVRDTPGPGIDSRTGLGVKYKKSHCGRSIEKGAEMKKTIGSIVMFGIGRMCDYPRYNER